MGTGEDAQASRVGDAPVRADRAAPIVVGASLSAEVHDRPVGERLARALESALVRRGVATEAPAGITPIVCTDLWYLNDDALRARPTISVGRPERNALSAYLGDKTPSAFVVDDVLIVQADPEMREAVACCWGVDADATRWAADAFIDRYLDAFVERLIAMT